MGKTALAAVKNALTAKVPKAEVKQWEKKVLQDGKVTPAERKDLQRKVRDSDFTPAAKVEIRSFFERQGIPWPGPAASTHIAGEEDGGGKGGVTTMGLGEEDGK